MTARGAIIGMAAGGLIWAAAGAAAAQELQAGQMMTQSEADRLEAVQADLDRMEAEEADETRRAEEEEWRATEERERLTRELERRRDAIENRLDAQAREEQRDHTREWIEQWEACAARMPADQQLMVEQILTQHALSVQSLRDSAGEGANVAVAVQQQQTQTDALLAAVARATCG